MNQQIKLSRNQINKLYDIIKHFDSVNEVTVEVDSEKNKKDVVLAKFTLFEVNDIMDNITEQ